jgi:hypothetical protein
MQKNKMECRARCGNLSQSLSASLAVIGYRPLLSYQPAGTPRCPVLLWRRRMPILDRALPRHLGPSLDAVHGLPLIQNCLQTLIRRSSQNLSKYSELSRRIGRGLRR